MVVFGRTSPEIHRLKVRSTWKRGWVIGQFTATASLIIAASLLKVACLSKLGTAAAILNLLDYHTKSAARVLPFKNM